MRKKKIGVSAGSALGDEKLNTTALAAQADFESQQLANTPKYPLPSGTNIRCHICGQIEDGLTVFEKIGELERIACPDCHPYRGRV